MIELVLALSDNKTPRKVKEYIKRLPRESFDDPVEREFFGKMVSTGDVFEAAQEAGIDSSKLAELYEADTYKVFLDLQEDVQIARVVSVLDEYNKKTICSYANTFQTSILASLDTVTNTFGKLATRIAKLPSFSFDGGITEGVDALLKQIADTAETGVVPIVDTPYKNLNDAFKGGFRQKGVVIITAPTGGFKTMFAQNLVRHWASHGREVLYVSTEMFKEDLVARWILQESYVNGVRLTQDALISPKDQIEYDKILQLSRILRQYPIHFCLIKKSIEHIEFAMRQKRYDVVVIDHLHQITGHDNYEKLGAILDVFVNYSNDNNSLIVLLAQNRKDEAYGEKQFQAPHLGQVHGSVQVVNAASYILAIHKKKDDQTTYVTCLKDRHGSAKWKEFQFKFIEDRCFFEEMGR
jgi:KaiC/GvpD/RAD55 family RecA-like ATPase